MRKIYAKPAIDKRAVLPAVTAQQQTSPPASPPSPSV